MNSSDTATGMQLAQAGRFADALPYLDRANRGAPTDIPLLHGLASLLVSAGRHVDAAERYRVAAALLPNDVGVLTGWARVLLMLGEFNKATEALDRALTEEPQISEPRGMLSMIWDVDDPDSACTVMRNLLQRHPANANLARQFAQALLTAERLSEAQAAFESYQLQQPNDPLPCLELGRLAASRGETGLALDHFRASLAVDPNYPRAHMEIAHATRDPLDPQTLEHVLKLEQVTQDPEDSAILNDVLKLHYERIGNYRAAAMHAARMNAQQELLTTPQLRYDMHNFALEVDATIDSQATRFFHDLRDAGNPDRRPVFVIGLPRSGTTLLEQMLASHPQIVGVGEQAFACGSMQRALTASGGVLQSLAPAVRSAADWHLHMLEDRVRRIGISRDYERIVDKMPDNYLVAGWLRTVFPNAAMIHVLRDPRDVALSCWLTQFARLNWAFRLEHIADRIEQHRRIMRHWRATIGESITEVRYEQLVANPESELRRALLAIGVDWHPDVLNFNNRKGFVASASRNQVRQSLHPRSIERWRNYEEALAPVLPRLNAIAEQDAIEMAAAASK